MATTITTYAGLVAIADDLTADYVLGNDIEASGENFTPLGTFTGTWDGQGYKIKNLTITISGAGTQKGALFTVNQGTIENLGLEDCVISVTSTGSNAYAGGITHENDNGAIRNCYTTGTITAISQGALYWADAGGICTWNENTGEIAYCYSTATITATSARHAAGGGLIAFNMAAICESYATGNVTATSSYSDGGTATVQVGGFATFNGYTAWGDGTITDCYAKGNVSATGGTANYAGGFVEDNQTADSTITNCYSIGTTTGATGDGGFCRTNSGTVSNCFWDTTTSSDAESDGGTGKTTAQMKTKATFTDATWNFIDTWSILSTVNSGYPYLLGIVRPPYTTPPIYDDHGRIAKGARIEARRNDTGHVAETQTLGASGKATFTELPNDVGVTFYIVWGGNSTNNDYELLYSTIIGVAEGGTGSSNPATGRTNLGLGTGDSPQFTAINLGHATDTTLARAAAGRATLEGVAVVRGPASATDNRLVKTDGTTGDLVQQTGITADDDNNVSGVAKLTTTSDIELGNASDTTLHRESAGLISVEGSNLIRASDVDDTPVDEQTAVPVSSNWAYDHNAATPSASVHPISDNVDFNLNQAVDLVVMTVANEAALPTEGIGVGQLCFATSELTLHICTVSS